MENTLIILTLHDETKKRAHDSQKVRAKENLKLSHGGSSYRYASGTNPPIKALHFFICIIWNLIVWFYIIYSEFDDSGW